MGSDFDGDVVALLVEHRAVSTELLLQDGVVFHLGNPERSADLRAQAFDFSVCVCQDQGRGVEIVRWLELLIGEMEFGQPFDWVSSPTVFAICDEVPDPVFATNPRGLVRMFCSPLPVVYEARISRL